MPKGPDAAGSQKDANVPPRSLEDRVRALESVVANGTVRARRVAIVDEFDEERIIGEVALGVAELRVDAPGSVDWPPSSVTIYASPDIDERGPSCGIQLWVNEEDFGGIDAWPNDDGRWMTRVHGLPVTITPQGNGSVADDK